MSEEIEKKLFKTYEGIRLSGVTNMFEISKIIELSKGVLTRKDIIQFMIDYKKLSRKYL